MEIHEATPDELRDWDERTVDVPGGNVYQSLAWGEHRRRVGWRARYLVFDDGFRLLSLERPWKVIGGAGAYLSRGPVSAGEPANQTADRLVAASEFLRDQGIDVVSSDAEIEASTGYPTLIETVGFHQIEEVQPSRHRLALDLDRQRDEAAIFREFAQSLRQRIRAAERTGLRAVVWDARRDPTADDGLENPRPSEFAPIGGSAASSVPVFGRFYDLLTATAARRHFALGPRDAFLDWSTTGLAAGHIVHFEVRSPDDDLLGGAMFYRHGGRLTYSHSGDRAELRRTYPGAIAFLLWRAIGLAMSQGIVELDLAGVDSPGKRRAPVEGEEMYGLYSFKRYFGSRWVELTGNHERVFRPVRYALGRVAGRLLIG